VGRRGSLRATVGARELKTRLGAYLQQVRQGRTLVVTDRGQPIAELRPLAGPADEDATLARLQALGAVTRAERRPLAPFRPIRPRGGTLVSDAIVADRDDRRLLDAARAEGVTVVATSTRRPAALRRSRTGTR
jgi:prevent-host-death family protein